MAVFLTCEMRKCVNQCVNQCVNIINLCKYKMYNKANNRFKYFDRYY